MNNFFKDYVYFKEIQNYFRIDKNFYAMFMPDNYGRGLHNTIFGTLSTKKEDVDDPACLYSFVFDSTSKHCLNSSSNQPFMRVCYGIKPYSFFVEKNSTIVLNLASNQPIYWLFTQSKLFNVMVYEVV